MRYLDQRIDAWFAATLEGLARRVGHLDDSISELGRALLAIPPANGGLGGTSQLNSDGTPLQLCLTASRSDIGARLIVDPAWRLGVPAERFRASLELFDEACRGSGAVAMRPVWQKLLDTARPDDERIVNDFTRGFFWVGVGVGKPGVAVYLDAKPYGGGAWDLAQSWLQAALPDPRSCEAVLEELRKHAILASIGFEGADPAAARAKLYWRLRQPVRLNSLGIDLLSDTRFVAFLAHAVGGRAIQLSGAVISLGLDLGTGAIEDSKLDICGHCLEQSPESWIATLDGLSDRLGVARFPVQEELLERRCEVAFIGLGVNRRGQSRLNLYLKPPGLAATTNLDDRIDAAVDYLVGLQRPDGSWEDYLLPVGRATQWVTAFAGLALAEASARGDRPEARAAAERAARWLVERRSYRAGWGYNDTTGVDADSTGLALRLVRRLGHAVQPRDEECLLSHWRRGGGFATYEGPDNWGRAHPCVTAVAFPALSASSRECLRQDLNNYLCSMARPDGTWPAYWWRTHFYSTYHHMILLRQSGLAELFTGPVGEINLPPDASDFELAYAVGIEHMRDPCSAAYAGLLDELLRRQGADGGWRGGANLRVTDSDCARPWESPQGELYRDMFGTVTTASAVMVLAEVINDRPTALKQAPSFISSPRASL